MKFDNISNLCKKNKNMKGAAFPLFETLYGETKDDATISETDLQKLCDQLKLLDAEGSELAYAIIRYYQVYHDPTSISTVLPYGSKMTKQGLKLDLGIFPKRLVAILYLFIELHMKKIQNDEERQLHTDMVLETV